MSDVAGRLALDVPEGFTVTAVDPRELAQGEWRDTPGVPPSAIMLLDSLASRLVLDGEAPLLLVQAETADGYVLTGLVAILLRPRSFLQLLDAPEDERWTVGALDPAEGGWPGVRRVVVDDVTVEAPGEEDGAAPRPSVALAVVERWWRTEDPPDPEVADLVGRFAVRGPAGAMLADTAQAVADYTVLVDQVLASAREEPAGTGAPAAAGPPG